MGSECLKGLFFVETLSRIFSLNQRFLADFFYFSFYAARVSLSTIFEIRICTFRKIRGLSCVSRVQSPEAQEMAEDVDSASYFRGHSPYFLNRS